ncbi:hypothetical protein [Lentzea sp.]|nr:hypothetical protein [Lentzea sp.]HUQ59377.1 hypothetical protein [Lentzea sp.]
MPQNEQRFDRIGKLDIALRRELVIGLAGIALGVAVLLGAFIARTGK